MKKIYILVILVALMSFTTNMTAYACNTKQKITVTVDSKTVKYEAVPYLSKGEVMIPAKETAEAVGGTFEWDKKKNTAWIHLAMTHLELINGKSEFYIHRDADFSGIPQTVKLNTSIRYSRGNVFVPGKTVFESLGTSVTWDAKKKALSISTNKSLNQELRYTIIAKEEIANLKLVNAWYNKYYTNAGIHSFRYNGAMYVLVSAGSKPTGGYSIGINKVYYETSTKAYINAFVKSPAPDMMVTQVETFPHVLVKIVGQKKLRSIKGELQELTSDSLPVKVSYEELSYEQIKKNERLVQWYTENNQSQGVHSIKDGGYIYALLGAGERPTGGYTLHIDKIYYSTADTVTVEAKVTPPGDNVRVIMMITYPSLLIRIKSDTLKTIHGEVLDTKISGVTLDNSNVTKMELYDLNQVKLKDITGSEKEEIMQAFRDAIIDYNPSIKMIAGKILKITTSDGYLITFSSYGSTTNIIASLDKGGVAKSYHLLSPGIAKYIYQ